MLRIFGRLALVIFTFCFTIQEVSGSEGYIVYFKDKGKQVFSPESFFHVHSLQKKSQLGLIASDESEWPVNKAYLQIIQPYTDSICGESRWLNAVLLYTSQPQVIRGFDFVKKMVSTEQNVHPSFELSMIDSGGNDPDWLSKIQTATLEDSIFSGAGLNGKNVRIAVFDAGFRNADKFEGLSHLFKNRQIEKTYNIPSKSEYVYGNNMHGTAVLTCLAGKYKEQATGLATGATFLLARTEYGTREPLREEFFWLMAAEWADQYGADIISSSLGYAQQRYFFSDMNGKTSIVSRAAGFAIRRGITVVNSAGNEGSDDWKYIITPADHDSVIAVGGLDPNTGYMITFSSFGPSASGQTKPNVIAAGTVWAGKAKRWGVINGTSFSCPLVAGFVACMMQHDTLLKNLPVQVLSRLEKSASLYPYFDYAHGYGIPKASHYLNLFKENQELKIENKSSVPGLELDTESIRKSGNKLAVKVKLDLSKPSQSLPKGWYPLLYFSSFDFSGKMLNYQTIKFLTEDIGSAQEFMISIPQQTHSIRFHYQGATINRLLQNP
jgi:subtilisin family serine protease